MHKYNSSREALVLREYGRNVQNLVKRVSAIEDKAARTTQAKVLLRVMATLDASLKTHTESNQKRWHDLLAMSGYELEVDASPPITKRFPTEKTPKRLEYAQASTKFRNYGRNIERFIQRAINTTDAASQERATLMIIRIMKQFGSMWHGDRIDCETVLAHLQHLSDNKLSIDRNRVLEAEIFQGDGKDRGKGSRRSKRSKQK
ncbi:MAG: DUF4290 domain-containing protein [Bacteroidota bacterium]